MKKTIIAVISFVMVGCANPSLERGFESLSESLAELDAAFIALDIEQMQNDIATAQDAVDQMTLDMEATEAMLQEMADNLAWGDDFDTTVLGQLTAMEQIVLNITVRLQETLVTVENMATSEQIQGLLAQVQDANDKVKQLVFLADYDYDGVMNGLDQCPDTPIEEINEVDVNGCSPSQLSN